MGYCWRAARFFCSPSLCTLKYLGAAIFMGMSPVPNSAINAKNVEPVVAGRLCVFAVVFMLFLLAVVGNVARTALVLVRVFHPRL